MAGVAANVRSGDAYIDSLLADFRWAAGPITYGFPSSGGWSGYPSKSEPYVGFVPLSAAMQAAARAVFSELSALTLLTFAENEGNTSALSAVIRLGTSTHSELESAHAYTPYTDSTAGDVWFRGGSQGYYAMPVAGTYAYAGFLHEIGHAVGLIHPHDADNFGRMPADRDAMEYTVMSYRSYVGAGEGYSNPDGDYAQTFMPLDIAALQHMYGANYSARSGDTLYRWDPSSGIFSIDGAATLTPATNRVFMSVWDGGGVDTYDLSAYSGGVKVSLAPGEWSVLSSSQIANLGDGRYAPGNVVNPYLHKGNPASLIENAIGGAGDDVLTGNQAANRLEGRGGSDTLDGGAGIDLLIGGGGDDLYIVSDSADAIVELEGEGRDTVRAVSDYVLPANVENLSLEGAPAGRSGTGNALANQIFGTSMQDVLDGGGGADTLHGMGGYDVFIVDDPGDTIVVAGAGHSVRSWISWTLTANFDRLELLGTAAVDAFGSIYNNELTGNDAANLLDGGGGHDRMTGRGGDDVYVVDVEGDVVVEEAGGGTDTVRTSVSWTLGAHVERAIAIGDRSVDLTGNGGANVLTGNGSHNSLNGAGGADLLIGGVGNDGYRVDDAGDVVVELAGEGTDAVIALVSYVLPDHVENLELLGTRAGSATGNGLANRLFGTEGANVFDGKGGGDELIGESGDDIYYVHAGDRVVEHFGRGNDTIIADIAFTLPANVENLVLVGSGAHALIGNALANELTGNGAANLLDGGGGGDVLRGGGGDDVYIVGLDTVVETADGGIDEVRTGLDVHVLADHVERLVHTGPSWAYQVQLTGNGLGNTVLGGLAEDTIRGAGGDDVLNDLARSGAMYGDEGDDRLVLARSAAGAAETHLLDGGEGNDLVEIDSALDLVLTVSGGAGADRIELVRFTAGSRAEIALGDGADLVLIGSNQGNPLGTVVLLDFSAGAEGDTIDLSAYLAARLVGWVAGANPFATGHLLLAQSGTDAVLSIDIDGNGDAFAALVTFRSVDAGALGQANLGFAVPRSVGTAGNDRLAGGAGADIFRLEAGGEDQVEGRGGDDIFYFGAAWGVGDWIDGGEGADELVLQGSYLPDARGVMRGIERLSLLSAADPRFKAAAGGAASYSLPARDEDVSAGAVLVVDGSGLGAAETLRFAGDNESDGRFVLLGGAGADTLLGGAGDDLLEGGAGHDFLNGNGGADLMRGGAGDDDYYVGQSGDIVEERADEGLDSVHASTAAWVLGVNLERLYGLAATGQALTGNGLANWIFGGGGNDLIDGGAGADAMHGGGGDDIFVVDDPADFVEDESGTDEIRTDLHEYQLTQSSIENLTGTAATGRQALIGNASANVISAGAGNDYIDGRGGADTMRGGAGDDDYIVDDPDDVVVEEAGGGTDRAISSAAAYRLAANVENLTAGLASGQALAGNDLANVIIGSSGDDLIDGAGGADMLVGRLGNDIYLVGEAGDAVTEWAGEGLDEIRSTSATTVIAANVEILRGMLNTGQLLSGDGAANAIFAGAGNDFIDGGAGADTMMGGLGNDIYVVDDASDQVIEAAGAGTDEIRTSLASYSLAGIAHVEDLVGTSAAGHVLTGNGLDNRIVGYLGDDTLWGGDGNDTLVGHGGFDTLRGGAGDDVYFIDAGDTIVEFAGEGLDTVVTQAEIFVLTGALENLRAGSDIAHDFRGHSGNNVIVGGEANDMIRAQDGGGDLLFGKGGVDSFYMGAAFANDDFVDGGDNRDSLILQGDYSAGLTLTWNITGGTSIGNIESLSLLSGSVTQYGDTAGNSYSYDLTLVDANIAAGALFKVNGFNLRAGENLTFDASAETDAQLQILGGLGTDTLVGGAMGDSFVFGHDGRFGPGDTVNGGGGLDVLYLRGDYTIDFNAAGYAGSLTSVESIALLTSANTEFAGGGDGEFDYVITWNDAMLASGVNMSVNGSRLGTAESFVFDGSSETGGNLRVFGGAAADTLTTGGGNDILYGGGGADVLTSGAGIDIFRYQAVSDSTAAAKDTIHGFAKGSDRIDVARIDADAGTAADEAFAFIGSNAFTAAGQLRAFNVSGDLWQVEGDVNGDGTADLVIQVHVEAGQMLGVADFTL